MQLCANVIIAMATCTMIFQYDLPVATATHLWDVENMYTVLFVRIINFQMTSYINTKAVATDYKKYML